MLMRWTSRCVGALAIGGLVVAVVATPAGASLTGGCQASGTQLQTGKSYNAVTTNAATIPRAARLATSLLRER